MDFNETKLTNTFWDLGMAMEDHQSLHNSNDHNHHHHHHQLPASFTSLWSHMATPSSSQIPSPSLFITDHNNGLGIAGNVPIEDEVVDEPEEELGAMKEMMYKIAAMQPVDIDPATIHKPKRRNVRISNDPQSVAARHRRERISEKIRILQRLVPGGTKMDTASMLDEAIRYVKFLKRQIRLLQQPNQNPPASSDMVAVAGCSSVSGDWQVKTQSKLPSSSSSERPQVVGSRFGFWIDGGEGVGSSSYFGASREVIRE